MFTKKSLVIGVAVSATLLLSACSNSNHQLTSAGSHVQFIDTKPAASCQLLGKAEGRRSSFFSGLKTHSELIRDAASDLMNKAAAMGGNVIYNAQDTSMQYISDIAPTDAVMVGEVYSCK
jgi:predicted secreted Zn-dependent protease